MSKDNLPEIWGKYPDTLQGREQLGRILPRWSFKGNKGKFYFSLDPKMEKESLTLVIIGGKPGRVYFKDPYRPGVEQEPACRSRDGIVPIAPGMAESCDVCPFSSWGENREAPACTQTYEFLAVEYDEEKGADIPFVFSVKRTSLAPANAYEGYLRVKERRPIWSVVTKITSALIGEDTENPYYIPVFTLLKELESKEAIGFYHIWERFQQQFAIQEPEGTEEAKAKKAEITPEAEAKQAEAVQKAEEVFEEEPAPESETEGDKAEFISERKDLEPPF